MKQNTSAFTALIAGAVIAFGTVSAPLVFAADKATNSAAAAKPLKAAKESLDKKQFADAISKLKAIQSLPGKNSYDDYLVNQMLYYAYGASKQPGEAMKVLDTLLASEYLPKSDVPKRSREYIAMAYQAKNYDKVIQLADKAAKEGFADDQIYVLAGQAYYEKGDYKGAAKFVENYIDSEIKSGSRPKEQTLLLVQSACDKTGDAGCKQRMFEKLVSYYPKQQYWQNLMVALNSGDTNDANRLQVYRLAAAVDTLKNPSDFTEYAQLALETGSPGEAQAVLERGFAKKVFVEKRDVDRNQRLLDSAKAQAAKDKPQLDKLASDAAAGKSGDKDVNVGVAYLGYQQYDKAVEALNRGLAKPGLAKPAEARLLLGIAQLNAGKKDDARKSFRQVKGDPTLERLANLWSLHSQA
jgi:TolA-binding protein